MCNFCITCLDSGFFTTPASGTEVSLTRLFFLLNPVPLRMSPSELKSSCFHMCHQTHGSSLVKFCLETKLSPSVKAGGYGVAGTNYSLRLGFDDHHRVLVQVGQYRGMSLLTYPYSGTLKLNCLPPPQQPTLSHTHRCVTVPLLAPPKDPSLRFKPGPLIRSDAKPRKHSQMTPRLPASSSQAASYSARKSMKLVPCSWTGD